MCVDAVGLNVEHLIANVISNILALCETVKGGSALGYNIGIGELMSWVLGREETSLRLIGSNCGLEGRSGYSW